MNDGKVLEDIKKCPYCKLKPVMDKRTIRLSNGQTYDEWKLQCKDHPELSTMVQPHVRMCVKVE